MGYFICNGQTSQDLQTATSTAFSYIMASSIVLNVYTSIRIKVYKNKFKVQPAPASNAHQGKAFFLKETDVGTLASYTAIGICFAVLALALACIHRLDNIKMDQLNVYPNYLCAYYINLFAPSFAMSIFIASFFRKAKIRKSFREEIANLFFG
jgi:hypothetical protein